MMPPVKDSETKTVPLRYKLRFIGREFDGEKELVSSVPFSYKDEHGMLKFSYTDFYTKRKVELFASKSATFVVTQEPADQP